MEIGGKELIRHISIFVIAEIASSHDGDFDQLLKLTDAVFTTGADAVKYQILRADSLLVPSHQKYQRFKHLEFTDEQWKEVFAYARNKGITVIAEVFDELSMELALELGVQIIKIPTSDLTNARLLSRAASTQKTIILSVGAAMENEIDCAVEICRKAQNDNLILMHGYQSFPTKIEDTNFGLLTYLSQKYDYPIGFADHIDAESELALYFPLIATGFGATIIEKHITLNRSEKGPDYYSALNPDEFGKLVALTRQVESAFGYYNFGCSTAEQVYRQLMKKMIVAAIELPAGHMVSENDLLFRRTEEAGLMPNDTNKVLGKAKRRIFQYSTIKEEEIEQE